MIPRDKIEAYRREIFGTKLDGLAAELRNMSYEVMSGMLDGASAELRDVEPAGFVARFAKRLSELHAVEPYDVMQFTRDVLRVLADEHRSDNQLLALYFEGVVAGLRENGEIDVSAAPPTSIGFDATRMVYLRQVALQREVDAPARRRKLKRDMLHGYIDDPAEEALTTSQRAAVVEQAALIEENTGAKRQRTVLIPRVEERPVRGPTELLPTPFGEDEK